MVRISSINALTLLCSAVAGKEINMMGVAHSEEYISGAKHAEIMKIKMAYWDFELASGAMNSGLYPELGYTKCIDGFAAAIPGDFNNTFACRNMDMYHFRSHASLGSAVQGQASSSWGWTSSEGREFVAIGHFDGTAFVEISSEGKMIYLGRLPTWDAIGARWREIRVVKDLLVVGSEAWGHGIQLFDMTKLLTLDPANPTIFTQNDLASHWGVVSQGNDSEPWDKLPVGRTHNVVVNQELGYAVAVGSVGGNVSTRVRENMPCNGGMIFLDISDPSNMRSTGCAAADFYVHDAQCVVYRGPDKRYEGRDICYAYNEDTVTIFDVTGDKKIGNQSTIISRTSYEGAEYIHQGVVLDLQNQEYLILDDEYDEQRAVVGPATNKLPTTHIFDIRDLESPKYTGFYQGKARAIDHNQYIYDGFVYQSNYGAGFHIYDISSIPSDPTGKSVYEAAFFDIFPEDDEAPGGGKAVFAGTWSSYAGFKSGFIYVNTIERGSFILKATAKSPPRAPVCNADNCLRAFRANSIPGRLEESQEFCGGFLARQRDVQDVTKAYAKDACTGTVGLKAQVSSACACLPKATAAL
ncbi:uncharacterized protein RSE6_03779 [Rhynchosporium secalis]|uniref:Uncharacterized protein n=1 Tax=Rhynchosporium secalis TaxID=38038 RepID=A0A1E1M3N4_RHYSE|nr:uncharacterized protein RSE6_03779 [Rhynchosporium secalis]